jgi:hypothetical protein
LYGRVDFDQEEWFDDYAPPGGYTFVYLFPIVLRITPLTAFREHTGFIHPAQRAYRSILLPEYAFTDAIRAREERLVVLCCCGNRIGGCITLVSHFVRDAFLIREVRRAPRLRSFQYFGLAFPYLMAWVFSTSVKFSMNYLMLERRRKESENENLKSELSLLRSQISPHFMFNVLNSLTALARKKSDGLEPVIIKLSQLMRYTIYHSAVPRVALETELEYLQNYIDLQRLRFGQHIVINFGKKIEQPGFQIEPMLLISFVENAFKHGSALVTDPSIDISIECNNGVLKFDVRNRFVEKTHKDETHGVGLRNVKRRLELLYENKYELNIKDAEPWFIVNLTLIGK